MITVTADTNLVLGRTTAKRDCNMITVTALMSKGIFDNSLKIILSMPKIM